MEWGEGDSPIGDANWVNAHRVPTAQSVFPEAFRPFGHTSQWMTLWTDHAAALAAGEAPR